MSLICKLFGCNFIKKEKEQPIEVTWKTKYTSYEECTRCKAQKNITVRWSC